MTKADLIEVVTQHTGLMKKDVSSIIEASFAAMTGALKKHDKVQIVGFGSFEPRQRKARVGRDPRTQQEIKIPASWTLGFKAGKQLKDAVAGKGKKKAK